MLTQLKLTYPCKHIHARPTDNPGGLLPPVASPTKEANSVQQPEEGGGDVAHAARLRVDLAGIFGS